jgi:hypothetical protein
MVNVAASTSCAKLRSGIAVTPDQRTLSSEFENVIVLSDELYQELTAHPVPNDLDAIKVLSASPAVLDLFMWLSYRCFTARGVESIPLFGDFGLANQIGTTDYSRPRRFRAIVEQWLGTIRALWPQCPARTSGDGQAILFSGIRDLACSCRLGWEHCWRVLQTRALVSGLPSDLSTRQEFGKHPSRHARPYTGTQRRNSRASDSQGWQLRMEVFCSPARRA